MTQCERVLAYLQTVGAITQLDAVRELGCYRLGARIWDLRHAGHKIKKTTITKRNRFGEAVSFARYELEE